MINLAVNSRVNDDKLKTTIHWGNNVPSTFSGMVEAITSFRKSEESNRLSTMIDLRPSKIILNDTIWKIHPSQITIDKNLIEIDNFLFEHQNQYVRANGRIERKQQTLVWWI